MTRAPQHSALLVLSCLILVHSNLGAEKTNIDTRFAARVARKFSDPAPRPSWNKRLRDTYWDAVRQVGDLPFEEATAALIRGGAKLVAERKGEQGPAFARIMICKGPGGPPGVIPGSIQLELTDMGPERPVYVTCELAIDLEGKNIGFDSVRQATGFPDNFVAQRVLFSQDCRSALEGQHITRIKISYSPLTMLGLPYTGYGFKVQIDKEPASETILSYCAASGYDPVYVGSRISAKANGMAVRDDVFLEVEEKDRIKDANGGKGFWKH